MINFKRSAWSSIAIAICSLQPSCGGSQPEPTSPEPTPAASPSAEAPAAPAPTQEEKIVQWYGECWDLFSAKKWDEFSKCYAPDATATRGSMPLVLTGRDQIIEKNAKVIATAFPDVSGERQITLASDNHVVSIALIRGTHTGPLLTPDGSSIPPTGKPIGFLTMHTVDVNSEGQAVKQWEVSNSPTMFAQLGLSNEPARPLMSNGFMDSVVAVAKHDATEAKNIEAHKAGYALFSKHDPKGFDFLADDMVCYDPTVPQDVIGKAENVAMAESFWKAFSDMHGDLDEVWGAGDYTIAFGHMRGTNDGDMPAMGLKKTGKKIDIRFGEMIKWDNGKVKAMYPFMDSMEMAAQLGLLDKPASKKPGSKPAAKSASIKPADGKATVAKSASIKPADGKATAPKSTGAKPTGKE